MVLIVGSHGPRARWVLSRDKLLPSSKDRCCVVRRAAGEEAEMGEVGVPRMKTRAKADLVRR